MRLTEYVSQKMIKTTRTFPAGSKSAFLMRG